MRADPAAAAPPSPTPRPADPGRRCSPLRRAGARRGTGDRLREALVALGEHHAQVLRHDEKAWASITFSGSRHTLSLLFSGEAAVAAGERFIAELSEHEFAIPGQIVADAEVTEAEHRLLPHPRLAVRCELLLLEEG